MPDSEELVGLVSSYASSTFWLCFMYPLAMLLAWKSYPFRGQKLSFSLAKDIILGDKSLKFKILTKNFADNKNIKVMQKSVLKKVHFSFVV